MSNLSGHGQLTGIINQGAGGGTSDYNNLTNKPKINNVELSGNKTTSDLNISYNDLTNKPTIRNVPDATGAEIGSVLTHTENGEAWAEVPKELPVITSSDEGKFLGVSNGAPAWSSSPGGGASYDVLTELSSGYYETNSVVTLNGNISDYDFLIFYLRYSNGELFSSSIIDSNSFSNSVVRTNVLYSGVGYSYVKYTSDTSITIDAISNVGVYKIVGVKL